MKYHDIYIDWELDGPNPYKPLLTRVITAALEAEHVPIPCGVDVLLTTDEGIREINLEQLRRRRYTPRRAGRKSTVR